MTEGNANVFEEMQPVDIEVVKWQVGHHGDFYKSAYELIARADDINLERLKGLFPVQIEAFLLWTRKPSYREELIGKMRNSAVWSRYVERI